MLAQAYLSCRLLKKNEKKNKKFAISNTVGKLVSDENEEAGGCQIGLFSHHGTYSNPLARYAV